ncbi:MAG: aldo/keto reductase [Kiritimatiellae bacterium]|jgi:methylglyoxal reductase|nr:aldo/keto reductase [Kiritimatiellia bacterium]
MKYKNIGMSDIKSSVVGLGTWAIGGWMWGGSDEKDAIRAIHAGIDEGINLIDTAPAYGFGKSEELVGKAIADRRDKVVLATKCGLIWHEQKGDFFFTSTEENLDEHGGINVYKCLSPEVIRYEVEQSLRRLKTDYIDIYQTHWQDFTTPIDETMQTLMELKKEGKIKAIGCSNATIEQMESYRRSGTLDADQELYSMLDRNHEQDNLPYVKEHGISFLAYSPLGQGLLTGKIGPDRVFEEGDQRRDNDRFSLSNRRKILTMLDSFRPIADAHGISLGQLVIAWIIAQPGCSHALVGARNPEQAVENAKAGSVILSVENLKNMQSVIDKFYD